MERFSGNTGPVGDHCKKHCEGCKGNYEHHYRSEYRKALASAQCKHEHRCRKASQKSCQAEKERSFIYFRADISVFEHILLLYLSQHYGLVCHGAEASGYSSVGASRIGIYDLVFSIKIEMTAAHRMDDLEVSEGI